MKILVTGGAGFIGSNLVEELLNDVRVDKVRVLDNLATGSVTNMKEFFSNPRFEFIEGDIRDYATCLAACEDVQLISHQAALGSVPRSVKDPRTSNEVNITGTLNMFTAARERKIDRVVYASSSSVYGNHPGLPKVEDQIGKPLSPYAITKLVDELYAELFAQLYDMQFVGLRYFNIFGPKQNPNGQYAAVIPLFSESLLRNESPIIFGDGENSRDFTYVSNAVSANILSLFTKSSNAVNRAYNIGCGEQTSLNQLLNSLKLIAESTVEAKFVDQRAGDVQHSLADISNARNLLGYEPRISVEEGLKTTFNWYKARASRSQYEI